LALPRSTGSGHYDRFRDRVTFPIANLSDRTIAFGARALKPDQEPKYLNSPETSIYHKGRVLYGLSITRDAIRRQDAVLVVEGYMDVVGLAQHGVGGAVATLGTAIGETHFRKLYRHTNDVVCCFDGDAAGRQAAWKAVLAAFPALSVGPDPRHRDRPASPDSARIVEDHGARHEFLRGRDVGVRDRSGVFLVRRGRTAAGGEQDEQGPRHGAGSGSERRCEHPWSLHA